MALEAALTHGEMSRHFRQHRLLPMPVTEKLLNRCFHSGVNPPMLHQLPALLLTHGCRHRIGLGQAAVQKGLRERGFITAGTIMNRAAQDSGKGSPGIWPQDSDSHSIWKSSPTSSRTSKAAATISRASTNSLTSGSRGGGVKHKNPLSPSSRYPIPLNA